MLRECQRVLQISEFMNLSNTIYNGKSQIRQCVSRLKIVIELNTNLKTPYVGHF